MDTIIAGIFFGILGSGYFMYGRKAQNLVALGCGVLLCVFPYFVDGLFWTIILGLALAAAPFLITL